MVQVRTKDKPYILLEIEHVASRTADITVKLILIAHRLMLPTFYATAL